MDAWDNYTARMLVKGTDKRKENYNREIYKLSHRIAESLSYQSVTIDDEKRNVAILDSDALNTKTIISLPNEDIKLGAIVFWMNNHWIVTEKDFNSTLYTKCKMIQCNYLLKWVTDDKTIHEQWCVIDDGTTYQTGEKESGDFVLSSGNTRISMIISKNEFTVNFGRENRFLIGDPQAEHKLAYTLSKPLKVGSVYNDQGVYMFVLQEVVSTEYDNQQLSIADYYKYFPMTDSVGDSTNIPNEDNQTSNDSGLENGDENNNKKRSWL